MFSVGINVQRIDGNEKVAGKVSFREVMQRHFRESEGEIWGRGYFKIEKDLNVPLGFPSPFWEIGFGAAEVEVDAETGAVKLLRYISLTDAGKMINPMQCEAQDEGAAVFGLGQALFGNLAYQDGQLLNGSLIDYCLRRFTDLPGEFTTTIMEGGGGRDPTAPKAWAKAAFFLWHRPSATRYSQRRVQDCSRYR
jgi:CO/xanthine dehydrogenase Mo-binding subunit